MNTKWNLNVLYKGLDDPEYEKDMKKAEELFAGLKAVVRSDEADSVKKIEDILLVMEEIEKTTGLTVVAPALNLQYLIKISARACDEPIGSDDIFHMNLSDFNHVRNMARNFMLRSDR